MSDEHWNGVVERLRHYARSYREGHAPPYLVSGLINDVRGHGLFIPPFDVWLILHELARMGVLIPGQRNYFNLPDSGVTIRNEHNAADLFNWPFFTFTPFGIEYLKGTATGVDPGRAGSFIGSLRERFPDIPEVAVDYVREAAASFGRGLYLATSVLNGVATEALLEHSYGVLAGHLSAGALSSYEDALTQKKRSAEGRFAIFQRELSRHESELNEDLVFRVKALLEPLVRMMKLNRDDVAHHRTTRINQNAAYAGLAPVPALVDMIAELETGASRFVCSFEPTAWGYVA